MLFNSFEFLIYLPLVFCGYWFVFRKLNVQNLFIVGASYLFYGWWDYRFLFLIFATTILCFFSGILIDQSENKRVRKWICGLNIAINISILCYFKYFNFFSENLNILFSQFGYELDWFTLDVLLPVGISFYTFQAISYPIDVYRKHISATKDIVAFTAFISFFPQLVAGPIERSTQLLPQFLSERKFRYYDAVCGMRQMLWGFFKKIVIADNCALLANIIFDDYAGYSSPMLILGAFFFTFQIYGDFSGYSDIAIGVSKLFGVNLSRNFHFPYFSRDISEFWRRWHISLNTWFRDYIYIPLGGSRCSKAKIIRNTMIIFLLSGLWHGANWTFIVWGAYHGFLFLPLILLKRNRKNLEVASAGQLLPSLKDLVSVMVTFVLVVIGWIIFRANNITEATGYLYHLIVNWGGGFINNLAGNNTNIAIALSMITVLTIVDWTQRTKSFGLQIVERKPLVVRWGAYMILLLVIAICSGPQEQFIYFQF